MKEMVKYDFAVVYADNKNNVWKLISKYVSSQEDREDLFQEVFLNIHRALPRFRGEAAVSTWVYRIAVNTALGHTKRQSRYKWIKKMLGGMRAVEAEIEAVAGDIKALKPLEKLNPRQRVILLLSDVEDKKIEEIAEIMKMPAGTVKSNLHRAREIVKKDVMENGGL